MVLLYTSLYGAFRDTGVLENTNDMNQYSTRFFRSRQIGVLNSALSLPFEVKIKPPNYYIVNNTHYI